MNHKRVERLWRKEGQNIQQKSRKVDFCSKAVPVSDYVPAIEIMSGATSLCIDLERMLNSESVLERMSNLFVLRVAWIIFAVTMVPGSRLSVFVNGSAGAK